MLFWAGIVWHRLSANQIVRCFKLKKLENYMRYQVDFLLPLKLQKISYYFGLCWKILLANQFAGFFTFDLCDLLILILGVHCYIVLVPSQLFSSPQVLPHLWLLLSPPIYWLTISGFQIFSSRARTFLVQSFSHISNEFSIHLFLFLVF